MAATIGKIGIVIPAFNCELFLSATLESILGQSHEAWECLVVDDGSADGTGDVAKRFATTDSRIRLVRQANGGQCIARNRGFAELGSDCRYITFMDGDDIWMSTALQVLTEELERHPEAVGAHGLGEFIDSNGSVILPGVFSALGRGRVGCKDGKPTPWPVDRPTTFSTVVTASVIFPPGLILTRRECYEKAGLFDPAMRYAEDWDLLIRLSRYGDFQFVNRVILGYRRHDSNTGAGVEVAKMCSRVRYKAFHSPENNADQRRIVKQSWRAAQIMAASDRVRQAGRGLLQGRMVETVILPARLALLCGRYVRGYPTSPR